MADSINPEASLSTPDEVVIVNETTRYGTDGLEQSYTEIAETNSLPTPTVVPNPAPNSSIDASGGEGMRTIDRRVEPSDSLSRSDAAPSVAEKSLRSQSFVQSSPPTITVQSPPTVTIETTPPPQDLRVRSSSVGVSGGISAPLYDLTRSNDLRPSSTPVSGEASTFTISNLSLPTTTSSLDVAPSASVGSHRYSPTPPPSFVSPGVVARGEPTSSIVKTMVASPPEVAIPSSERSGTPHSVIHVSSTKPGAVVSSRPVMTPSSDRSSTPQSLSKRDEVLKSLKQEGRWSDEEEEGDEEGEENEEEDDDDIIPLDFHIKVEEFYRDILHSNGDSEVQIEAIRPSVGGKLIRAPAAKMALQNQLPQSSVSSKSISASSKGISGGLIQSKPMNYDVSQCNGVTHQNLTHVGGQKQVIAQKSTALANTVSQPTNGGYYSTSSSVVQSALNDDGSNHMPDVIVTATHPPCEVQQQHPPPQHISQPAVHHQSPPIPVQQHTVAPSVNYPMQQVYAPPLPPQFQQQQQPATALALHPQQSQPNSQSVPTAPFPFHSLHSLYSAAGTATTYDPVTATTHSSPVILVNLADLKKPQSKTDETVVKVTQSTQTVGSIIKSELRHDAGDESPAYADEDDNENVLWEKNVAVLDKIIVPSKYSIGTSTDPPSPSPPREHSTFSSRSGTNRVMKQIQKTTFGIRETDKSRKWEDKTLKFKKRRAATDCEGRRARINRHCRKVACLGDTSRNVEVLQSNVYVVSQGDEKNEFVQNSSSGSLRKRDLRDSNFESEGDDEESEEEAPPPETPSKSISHNSSSRRRKKKAVVVEVEDDIEEEIETEEGGDEDTEEKDEETYTLPESLADFAASDLCLKKIGNNTYKCRYCEKEYTHSASRKTHERKHTGELPFTCPSCEKGFSHLSNFKRHVKGCKGPEGADLEILSFFKCPACGQQFKHKKSLSTHYKFKHERSEIDCQDCGGKFPSPAYLERHKPKCKPAKKNGKAPPERRLFYCQICGWNARWKKALEGHMSAMHNLPSEIEEKERPTKKRSSRKRESGDGQLDEKPLVIDLCSAKWMGK